MASPSFELAINAIPTSVLRRRLARQRAGLLCGSPHSSFLQRTSVGHPSSVLGHSQANEPASQRQVWRLKQGGSRTGAGARIPLGFAASRPYPRSAIPGTWHHPRRRREKCPINAPRRPKLAAFLHRRAADRGISAPGPPKPRVFLHRRGRRRVLPVAVRRRQVDRPSPVKRPIFVVIDRRLPLRRDYTNGVGPDSDPVAK